MPPSLPALAGADPGAQAAAVVEDFLRLIMVPDPVAASRHVDPQLRIRFTGGRPMSAPAECSAFNARRYAWVKKRLGPTEVVAGATADHAVVYSTGTLHGAWPDGTSFEGNRYVDRYVVRQGLIVDMQVWNDSAEWMLVRAGLAPAWSLDAQPVPSTTEAAA